MDNNDFIEAEATMERAARLNPNDEKIGFYKENLIRIYKKFGPFFQRLLGKKLRVLLFYTIQRINSAISTIKI